MADNGVWLSLARAPGLGPGGRRFESCHPDLFKKIQFVCASGSVVEYRLAKARVAGSNPVSRFFLFPGIFWFYKEFRAFVYLEICIQL